MRKRGLWIWEHPIGWIIAIAVLVLLVILFMTLSDKGTGAIRYVLDLVRFR